MTQNTAIENDILPKAYEIKKAKSNVIDANELVDTILWHIETWLLVGKTYAEAVGLAIEDYQRRIKIQEERKPFYWEARVKGFKENIDILETLKAEL